MPTRKIFSEELASLKRQVMEMGALIEAAIDRVSTALSKLDSGLSKKIIDQDDAVDRMEQEIEQQCIDLVVSQAPVASDWREIAAIMRLIADLERIADHCSDISEYIIILSEKPHVAMPPGFPEMFSKMKQMVSMTIESFVASDLEQAAKIIALDDTVDRYFAEIKQSICDLMKQSPEHIEQYADYLMIDKYIERMADHSTNVAKWISFIVKGKLNLL